MDKKSRAELVTWHCRRISEMQMPHRHRPEGIDSLPCGAASRLVLALLLVSVSSAVGCGKTIAAPAVPVPEVEVASVVQKDVPIFSEWVATLDGFVNAQIQPQVTGYLIKQNYVEGSFVRKGEALFEIDPRPF